MGRYQCTEETFLKDVAQHQMTVLRDDGVYRHVRFSRPGTTDMLFDLVTWPWHLCYTGDMGTYVFTRVEDMFQFFRARPGRGDGLYINTDYWSEKCVSADRDGIREYSADLFKAAVLQHLDDDATAELREAVEEAVLCIAECGEDVARQAVSDFEHDGFQFVDFQEAELRDYTNRFVWCCYALAWGIRAYDAKPTPPPKPVPPPLREIREGAAA